MPTVLTPQGWVKVAPAPRKKAAVSNPKVTLRGPLAYLACQPQAPTVNVGAGVKGKAPFPYDLSASPEKLKRQNHANINRTVSAPVMRGALHNDDDYDVEIVEPRGPRSKPSNSEIEPRSKHKHRRPRHHDDDNHSVASSGSSSSSGSSNPSDRSYNRRRPVEARPRPTNDHYYSPPRHDQHFAPPHVVHVPMPMPPSNGRSLSYSWYNATTPLNLN